MNNEEYFDPVEKFMRILYTLFCVLTAMVGYTIHHSIWWSIVDFFFTPIAIVYWLITHQITLAVIKSTFSWFFV